MARNTREAKTGRGMVQFALEFKDLVERRKPITPAQHSHKQFVDQRKPRNQRVTFLCEPAPLSTTTGHFTSILDTKTQARQRTLRAPLGPTAKPLSLHHCPNPSLHPELSAVIVVPGELPRDVLQEEKRER